MWLDDLVFIISLWANCKSGLSRQWSSYGDSVATVSLARQCRLCHDNVATVSFTCPDSVATVSRQPAFAKLEPSSDPLLQFSLSLFCAFGFLFFFLEGGRGFGSSRILEEIPFIY